ncbi:hypothetical protein [Streptomyces sp. WAC 01325]|uniref:hypothetical protein n=1 Tax=Streptomyces sp. WAC 01325 TaxID=2203202 RepID=UPI000F87035D|nr:hypothetical protein [Streptomyces sp. WAC 01325]
MPFVLFVDERWLLDVAQNLVPGDPDITDYGALAAAVARHQHEVMGTLVYPAPHHRAAALLHCLARIPALKHSIDSSRSWRSGVPGSLCLTPSRWQDLRDQHQWG